MNHNISRSSTYIAIFQIFIAILSIFGNKISELIDIPIIWQVIIFVAVLAVVIGMEIYKNRKRNPANKRVNNTKPSVLTKSTIRLGLSFLGYYPLALFLCGGAIFLAYKMEPQVVSVVPWWFIVLPIISSVMLYPFYVAQEHSIGHKLKYMRIAVALALSYCSFGVATLLAPDILQSQTVLVIYAILSNIVNVTINFAYMFYLSETVFVPWYNRLPE